MKRSNKSFTELHRESVKRQLGDYPVRDAKKVFRFFISEEDTKTAKKGDPRECALAQGVSHFIGGKKAIAIFHTCAYIPMDKNGDGKIVIERFMNPSATRRAIEKFDRTGEFQPGEYYFNPPSKSVRMGSQKEWKLKKEKQLIRGSGMPIEHGYRPRGKFLGVRNGSGQVSFRKKRADKSQKPEKWFISKN